MKSQTKFHLPIARMVANKHLLKLSVSEHLRINNSGRAQDYVDMAEKTLELAFRFDDRPWRGTVIGLVAMYMLEIRQSLWIVPLLALVGALLYWLGYTDVPALARDMLFGYLLVISWENYKTISVMKKAMAFFHDIFVLEALSDE